MRQLFKKLRSLFALVLLLAGSSTSLHADTQARQFQLNAAPGLFIGTKDLGTSFDFALEPEFFFSEHTSISLRIDVTAGATESVHLGSRFRYYFDFENHERFNLFLGLGFGGFIKFDGADAAELEIPTIGWQYDLTEHFKLGSDLSLNLFFNSTNTRFGTRLMPLVVKWAF